MINSDGSFGRKYEHVIDRDTGAYVVLKNTRHGQIQPDAEFFDPEKHSHLTPDCCAVPGIQVIDGYFQAGGKWVATHFKIAHGQHHGINCPNEPKNSGDEDEVDHTLRDEGKGPVIFLNGSLSDFARDFKNAAKRANEDRLVYRDEDNKWIIRDEDLESRPRLNASSPEDLFTLMKRKDMTQARLNDAKIIFDDTIINWDKFFIRGRRLIDLGKEMMTTGAAPHPVLLHARMFESATLETKKGIDRLKVRLPKFVTRHPETGEDVKVHPFMYVRDKSIFSNFLNIEKTGPQEFFVLTSVQTSAFPRREKGAPTWRYISDEEAARETKPEQRNLYIHFELKPHLYVRKTLAELKAEIQKKSDFMASLPANGNVEPS